LRVIVVYFYVISFPCISLKNIMKALY